MFQCTSWPTCSTCSCWWRVRRTCILTRCCWIRRLLWTLRSYRRRPSSTAYSRPSSSSAATWRTAGTSQWTLHPRPRYVRNNGACVFTFLCIVLVFFALIRADRSICACLWCQLIKNTIFTCMQFHNFTDIQRLKEIYRRRVIQVLKWTYTCYLCFRRRRW